VAQSPHNQPGSFFRQQFIGNFVVRISQDENVYHCAVTLQFLRGETRSTGDPAMSGSIQDKRSDARVAIIAAVEVIDIASGTRLSSRTSDISRSGCYIDTLNPTPVKAAVRVRLSHAGEELEVAGRIVYVSPGLGMGVRFDENLSPAQLACLDRWLSGAK
jgi:PilZ domain